MSKFKWIIVDTFTGNVFGTNDEAVANSYIGDQEAFVIQPETNSWLLEKDCVKQIEEKK